MRGWRRGRRGNRLGRGGGGAWGRRRRGWGVRWALIESEKAGPSSRREKAAALARDDDASPRRQIVDQVGIVDQEVKQVKAGISPQRAQRPQRLERFALGYLTLEKESFRKLALAADFEGAEVLVPQTLGRFRLGFAPEL